MDRTESLTSQIRITLVLLATLAAAVVIGVSVMSSIRIDQDTVAKQREFVLHALEDEIAAVPREQESITVWDDHVLHARAGDQQWLAENVGEWMFQYFGHERAYVLDDQGNPVYAMRGGETVRPVAYLDERAAVEEIASHLRARLITRGIAGEAAEPLSDILDVRVLDLAGRPAILSVRPIVPFTDRITVPAGSEYLYASIKLIDDALATKIGNHILLQDMRFESEAPTASDQAAVPVVGFGGETLGYLAWKADRPGIALLKQIAPAGSFALLVTCGAMVFLGRRLHRASLQLQASERRARHLASHDVLTRLPNRAFFEEQLDEALGAVRAGKGEAAVLFLDLDRFKNINDTLGHRAGDELVRQTAARLNAVMGEAGAAARIGGDEFGIVFSTPRRARAAAIELADRLLVALKTPFSIDDELVHVSTSIGIAVAPEAGSDRQELLRKADIALYDAKKKGRGCHQVFTEVMGDVLKQRRRVEADLRNALTTGTELQLHYQPLYSNAGEMSGAEALLRWNHPVHGAMSPLFLISIAEEAGMIMQLGDWILKEACQMAAITGLPLMSVNVSAVQLRDEHFAERCLAIMHETGVAPDRIQIEVTEAVLIENPELAVKIFGSLRAAGIRVAIDDFGTGYSSMSYLQHYPVDRLKIDRSFIQGLADGNQGQAIVAAMLEMARALNLEVIAEGVETLEQCNLLQALGCQEMQGYLFSRPLEPLQFLQTLRQSPAIHLKA